MSFGWLRERVYNAYLEAVSNCGEWYVHPLGEDPADINPGRRCFTKRGAEKMRNEFDASERAAAEPHVKDQWETATDVMTWSSYEVDTVWCVSRWPISPWVEMGDAARKLQDEITRDLFFPMTA